MARTAIALTEVDRSGVAPGAEVTYDAVNKNSIPNDGKVLLLVRNAHATVAQSFTVAVANTVDGQAVTPRSNSVAATASKWYGPFPPSVYGDQLLIDGSTTDLKFIAYHHA